MSKDENEIRELLQQLQKGYKERDANYIDSFMQIYSKNDSSLIIGTNQNEVFRGFEGAKELFLNDWNEWGDVEYDLNTGDISIKGDSAWVFMNAKVKMKFTSEFLNNVVLQIVKSTLENEEKSEKAKILDILTYTALSIIEQSKGEIFDCPIRVTAFLTKEEEKWVINHMHFSFPTALFPSVRTGNW